MANYSPLRNKTEPISHICPSISSISISEDRVNALFSPFRPREINPESYDRKIKFWVNAIEEFTTFGNRLTFTLKEVQKALMINEKTPAGLQEVLEYLRLQGMVLTEQEYYEDLKASVSWVSWSQIKAKKLVTKLVPIPNNPLKYLWRGSPQEIRYIHVKYLKDIVNLVSKDTSVKNRLMSLKAFMEMLVVKSQLKDVQELEYVMEYMKTRGLIELDKVGREDVVLYGDGLKINDAEKGKYDVKRSIEIHEEKLEELNLKIEESLEKAKKFLKLNRRQQAKLELKKKKLLEQRAEKLMQMIDSLTVISLKIDHAESDATILQAYKSGKQALTETLKKNNLTADNVVEAMLDVQDCLDEQAEISAAISQPLDGSDDDLTELDAELESLLKEDEEKEQKRQVKIRAKEEEEALRRLERITVGDDFDDSIHNSSKESDAIHSPA